MIEIRNIQLPLDAFLSGAGVAPLHRAVARALNIAEADIAEVHLLKRSVDARKKTNVHFVATLGATLSAVESGLNIAAERSLVDALGDSNVVMAEPYVAAPLPPLGQEPSVRPIVVGTGPAGLFAALHLARAGARPLVLERGQAVADRVRSWDLFVGAGELDRESNIQFGEGGAGTFSDGKLTTNTKDPRCRSVLRVLADAGAPEEILWQAKPHVGTDRLRGAVMRIRKEIESLGGEVRFRTRLVSIEIDPASGALSGAVIEGPAGREEIAASQLILATGHSARDTFEMLHSAGVRMVQKPFSIGVRIEHNQRAIDRAQYGSASDHPALGAAEYKLSAHLPSGRSAYTFCMCPGGEVVASTSELGGVVTNGMSYFARDGVNANSGLLVNVGPADFGADHPLAGVEFQRRWEREAFALGGGAYRAPAQLVGDFLRGAPSTGPRTVQPTYSRGVKYTNLEGCLPDYVTSSLREAIPIFDQRLRGFSAADAVMTGVETRSSSPVRILRDESLQSSVRGLYPCGEGAGYAGGIMSAAVDGLRCAEAVLGILNPTSAPPSGDLPA